MKEILIGKNVSNVVISMPASFLIEHHASDNVQVSVLSSLGLCYGVTFKGCYLESQSPGGADDWSKNGVSSELTSAKMVGRLMNRLGSIREKRALVPENSNMERGTSEACKLQLHWAIHTKIRMLRNPHYICIVIMWVSCC